MRSPRVSPENGCSRPLRVPYSHQISLVDASAASAWSIASTGVSPIPALNNTTGVSPDRSVKLPRAALSVGGCGVKKYLATSERIELTRKSQIRQKAK